MAPRKRPRYRVIKARAGLITIDRLTRTWCVTVGGNLIDHGHLDRPEYTTYLTRQVRD